MLAALTVLAQEAPDASTDACGPTDTSTYVCRKVFEWTESDFIATVADWIVARPLMIIFILVAAWFLNRLARRGIRRFVAHSTDVQWQQRVATMRRRTGVSLLDTGPVVSARRGQRAAAIGAVLRSISTVLIYGIAALMALGELGINLGPLIAGAGIVGVALGFGAQSLVKDFLSGVFMIVEDQFGVGDVIDVGDAIGVVEAVSLRTTRLRDLDGTLWHFPNGEIRRVGNKSQDWARALLDIDVAYGSDVDRAAEIIKRVADEMRETEEFRRVILEEPEIWGVQALGADGVSIRLVIKTRPGEQFNLERKFRWKLKKVFDDEGIEIPFPQRTVWLRGGTVDDELGDGPTGAVDTIAPESEPEP